MAVTICHRCISLLKSVGSRTRSLHFGKSDSWTWSLFSLQRETFPHDGLPRNYQRQYATKAKPKEDKKPGATKKAREKSESQLDVGSELEKKSRLDARQMEKEALKRYPFLSDKAKRQVYVMDPNLADDIVSVVRKHQTDCNVPVLEANPGPGFVTKALLKSGVKQIVAAEALNSFIPYLLESNRKHIDKRLKILNWDHFSLYQRMTDNDTQCAYKNYEDTLATLLPHKDWADGPPLTVVGVIPANKDRMYLTHLLLSAARGYGLFMLGRPEWFLLVSPAVYKNILLTGTTDKTGNGCFYSQFGITFSLLFDIQFCAEFPCWRFVPHFTEKRKAYRRQEVPGVSDDMRYMLRLRPRSELALPHADIPAFHSFLNQVMKRKKQRLIPKMEQLIPGCGVHLVMMGFSMMLPVLEVTPQQFVSIFKVMHSWPEFEGSPMKEFLTDTSTPTIEEERHDEKGGDKED